MRFSVIMPLYNKAPYTTKAIESVLLQRDKDYELIVINDGSTDDSLQIVEGMLQENRKLQNLNRAGRFTLINQKNCGVSTTRNNGVNIAKGDYICFLDADDWWDVDFLKGMDSLISNYPDAGIYGCNYWYVKNKKQRECVLQVQTGYVDYIKTYLNQIELGGGMPLWTGAVVVKRTVFEEMNGFKTHMKLGEDFDLWLRIALKYKVAFLNEPLSFYNQNAESHGRTTKQLQKPEAHEVFNYDCFAEEEKQNPDLKLLLDKKRVIGLQNYYLSKQYRNIAKQELAKVDWSKLPKYYIKTYKTPVILLKVRRKFMTYGSYIKQLILLISKI